MPKIPPAVRILPMTRNLPDFCDWDVAGVQQEFFLDRLPAMGGRFHFPTSAMNADEGTVVLFQYLGLIVASAELLAIERYGVPKAVRGLKFRGAYHFDPLTIRTFRPVEADGIRRFWPQFTRFGHAKQTLAPQPYAKFARFLREVQRVGHL